MVLNKFIICALLLSCGSLFAKNLTLSEAEQIALERDPAQKAYELKQSELIALGEASNSFADPMIKLGVANVPTDSFMLDEDPMSQLTFGISQQFGRGDQLGLRQKGFELRSKTSVCEAEHRQLFVKQSVRELWLSLLLIKKSNAIIKKTKNLFEINHADVIARFSLGLIQSQDVILYKLELNRFDEKVDA